ncbi:DUF883 C-terminal domain-containing protein [Pseudomonas jilinensis]|uniref:DUF883 domain-containing protein n=1 Tax=Pseudomonas jilinensis TaxID=2078689 RepID=A0A396RZT5_9PSED|nr:DUF883 C-terminal domain-containing protein [Pseudomonas jilinensis]PAU88365.1 hypothetical protein CK507_07380 [Pseudomonas sp. WN033]RHW22160.1 hypothetical protein C2846_03795 [Pseudomonas jilinensis]
MADAKKEANGKEQELEASKEALMAAYRDLMEAKEHFTRAAEAAGLDLKQEATEQLLKGKHKAEELGQEASRYLQEKPLASVGIAFIAGFIFSQLFSRR